MSFKAVERLQRFSDHNIGLEDDALRLVPYHESWKRLFSDEAYLIFNELRHDTLRLYHCGSTAVPHMDAKPIIDIVGSVSSLEEIQASRLERLGYVCKGNSFMTSRLFFVLYNPERKIAFVHLSLFQHGDGEIQKHLDFRNYLRSSLSASDIYTKRKRYLVGDLKMSPANYSDAKTDVIAKIQNDCPKKILPQKILAVHAAAEGHRNTLQFLQETYCKESLDILSLSENLLFPYSYVSNPTDHFHAIIRKALDADIFVFATPVYWYAMSGAMKDFLDRFSNLLSGKHKSLGESLNGKKVHLISTGSDPILPLGFEVPFAATSIYFGMDYMGAFYKSIV